MGHHAEFPSTIRLFLQAYRWRRIDPVPWEPLSKPLSECRVALVTSAGLVEPDQERFDASIRGGDHSYRWLSTDVDVQSLIESHRSRSFDRAGIEADKEIAFPIGRLRELAAAGRIGSVSRRHLSFMGSITAPGRLMKHTAPEAAKALAADGVDVALLVPI